MRYTKFIIAAKIVFILLLVINLAFIPKGLHEDDAANMGSFAVVELFTSEGCSSCPPADILLSKLSTEFKGTVFVLGFHVDYWNNLGWKDVFSNEAYTKRQSEYGKTFHLNSVYTPQAVVNGKTQIVGSDEKNLRNAINEELRTAARSSIRLTATNSNNQSVNVSYKIDHITNSVLNVALVQLHAQSNVKRGENSGKVLQHINVVRDFKMIDAEKNAEGNLIIQLPAGTSSKDFAVIAFTQNKNDRHIIAASQTPIQ